MQGLVGVSEGVVHEEGRADAGEEDEDTTEEDHADVQVHRDVVQQVWKNWTKKCHNVFEESVSNHIISKSF